MSQEQSGPMIAVEAGLTPEGSAMLSDPAILILAGFALTAFVIGRFVIGPRDPDQPRKWWDYRRVD